MHAFQAPDLTADDGTTAYVTPGVEVLVTIGLQISSAIQLGIFASIGLDVELRPGGHGGIVDASRGLTQALHDSNPPDTLPCSPTISQSVEHVCSDMQYDSLEPGSDPDSTYACTEAKGHSCCVKFTVSEGGSLSNVYACIDDWTGIDEAHCGCATADTKECLRDYQPYLSATTYGQVANAMAITQIQSTWNASQSCADCKKDGSCPIQESPSDPPFDNPCETHGYCVDGATTTYDVLAAQCAGEFHRYGCVPRVISEVTGWTGPGCHPLNQGFPSACGCGASGDCASGETCNAGRCENGSGPVDCSCDPGISGSCPSGRSCIDGACVIDCGACGAATTCSNGHCLPSSGVPFAEQIVWTSTHVPSPLHSIESYGLVDFKLQAILDAALEIALKIKLFKKVKEFKVWDWSDAWDLGSTWKSKYQPGLEAQYEDPCDPIGTVTNHEPSAWGCSGASTLVCRYPSSADSAWASYDTPTELIAACKDEMPLHVENPPAPTGADFADGLTDLADFGLSVGETVWNQSQLCVGDGKQTFTEWLTSLSASPSTLSCTYTGPTPGATPSVFPCAATDTYLLQIWGCLDTSAAPSVVTSLGTISPMYSSSLTDPSVVDLAAIVNPASGALIGPAAVLPAPQKLQVYAWLAAVEACFDNHHAAEEPCVQLTGASGLHRCCGDGVKLASEACDDGNTAPGDGCAYDCTIEAPKP
ncbi:MAG: hypothetical protein IT381_25890 [Deltaproteobacteria bacterium]|nr:hypothetical protein [Deltaproteobacteria bacterium]